MNKEMIMKNVAKKALSALEGLDASNVKAVSIVFGSGGMHKMPDGSMMKDSEHESEDEEYGMDQGEESSSGQCCGECGHKMNMGEEECPMCGADANPEETKMMKNRKTKSEDYVDDEEADDEEYRTVVNKKEAQQLKSVKGK